MMNMSIKRAGFCQLKTPTNNILSGYTFVPQDKVTREAPHGDVLFLPDIGLPIVLYESCLQAIADMGFVVRVFAYRGFEGSTGRMKQTVAGIGSDVRWLFHQLSLPRMMVTHGLGGVLAAEACASMKQPPRAIVCLSPSWIHPLRGFPRRFSACQWILGWVSRWLPFVQSATPIEYGEMVNNPNLLKEWLQWGGGQQSMIMSLQLAVELNGSMKGTKSKLQRLQSQIYSIIPGSSQVSPCRQAKQCVPTVSKEHAVTIPRGSHLFFADESDIIQQRGNVAIERFLNMAIHMSLGHKEVRRSSLSISPMGVQHGSPNPNTQSRSRNSPSSSLSSSSNRGKSRWMSWVSSS